MSYYRKGLETPCDTTIVVPVDDDTERFLETVDTGRKLVTHAPGTVRDVHSMANFLGGRKKTWLNYFKGGC